MSEQVKMDPELKAKWVKALRSGEYRQGRGTLRDTEGRYCCLGVFCVVAGIELDPRGKFPAAHPHSYQPIGDMIGGDLAQLYNRNDGEAEFSGRPLSFPEIADYIEESL